MIVASLALLTDPMQCPVPCGFFKRSAHFREMPTHHGVQIRKEQRYRLSEGFLVEEDTAKKHWITNWSEKTRRCF
ncbi:hypothetical protein AALO_G00086180 [Alosa alosa]|uniref:Uncharacterized protein n=1 Tax=Alosa alosa TaxID=278164 RepID=A0AAV6GYS2_9TELE|nr:hypothetical protein AALO_G00086180 [Alosa alosa]